MQPANLSHDKTELPQTILVIWSEFSYAPLSFLLIEGDHRHLDGIAAVSDSVDVAWRRLSMLFSDSPRREDPEHFPVEAFRDGAFIAQVLLLRDRSNTVHAVFMREIEAMTSLIPPQSSSGIAANRASGSPLPLDMPAVPGLTSGTRPIAETLAPVADSDLPTSALDAESVYPTSIESESDCHRASPPPSQSEAHEAS